MKREVKDGASAGGVWNKRQLVSSFGANSFLLGVASVHVFQDSVLRLHRFQFLGDGHGFSSSVEFLFSLD